jgi:hypothetical protein
MEVTMPKLFIISLALVATPASAQQLWQQNANIFAAQQQALQMQQQNQTMMQQQQQQVEMQRLQMEMARPRQCQSYTIGSYTNTRCY